MVAKSDAATTVLTACGCTEAELASLNCDILNTVIQKCGQKILELIPCVGQSKTAGDERFTTEQDIEALLRIMAAAEKFCRVKRAKLDGFTAFALPAITCESGRCGPDSVELTRAYEAACSCSGGRLYG